MSLMGLSISDESLSERISSSAFLPSDSDFQFLRFSALEKPVLDKTDFVLD